MDKEHWRIDMSLIKKCIEKNPVVAKPTWCQWQRLALFFAVLLLFVSSKALAEESKAKKSIESGTEHGSLSELGAKLSNPLSDVWALFTEFDVNWSRGDLSNDDYKTGGDMIFQPLLPFRVTKDLKMITRPTVPVVFGGPIPDGIKPDGTASFDHKTGIGDISIPFLFSPVPKPGQILSFGGGPTLQFPTHTSDELGMKTWEAGPAAIGIYKTQKVTIGALGQYWWSYAEYGSNTPSTSHGSLVYFYFYNLPKAMQVGFNPTVTYNDKASSGNKWNVPVGITVAKMTKVGKLPVKFQFGVEYSVVRQDNFGPEWRVKLNIIPVLKTLQKKPFF
jgi:hypothetical protein